MEQTNLWSKQFSDNPYICVAWFITILEFPNKQRMYYIFFEASICGGLLLGVECCVDDGTKHDNKHRIDHEKIFHNFVCITLFIYFEYNWNAAVVGC